MDEARFGEHMSIDPTNRLDVKNNENIPPYISFGRQLRDNLTKSAEIDGWPSTPENLTTPEDLFENAKAAVTERWALANGTILAAESEKWLGTIPDGEEFTTIKAILSDPELFEEKLRIKHFDVLEPLRKLNPEAWRTLLVASSERQLAEVVLLKRWIKDVPDVELGNVGLSREELLLFTDMAGIFGKFVDQVYIKQVELADAPGGSSETKLADADGSGFIYDPYISEDSDDIVLKTYSEVFPFEWGRLSQRFIDVARKTTGLLQDGKLPSTYGMLPYYLQRLGEVYGSDITSLDGMDEMWEELYKDGRNLSDSECPLMIIAQGSASVAGEAEKVDAELRLGIRTKKTHILDTKTKSLQGYSQAIVDANIITLQRNYDVADVIFNYQPFAFGPNLHGFTRGESTEGEILTHANAVEDVAAVSELPLLRKMIALAEIEPTDYLTAANIETALHEYGHEVIHTEDKKVKKRIGKSRDAIFLEELKGETVGMLVLKDALESGKEDFNPDTQLLAKVGTLFDYVANKAQDGESGSDYYYLGTILLERMLSRGVLVAEGGKYALTDGREGIGVLAGLGEEILELYTSDQTTPAKVKEYVKNIKKVSDTDHVKELISRLQSTGVSS